MLTNEQARQRALDLPLHLTLSHRRLALTARPLDLLEELVRHSLTLHPPAQSPWALVLHSPTARLPALKARQHRVPQTAHSHHTLTARLPARKAL